MSAFNAEYNKNLPRWVGGSVTRWLDFCSMFGHSQQLKFTKSQKIAMVCSNFCQILNTSSKILPNTIKSLPKWRYFVKSGHTGGWGDRKDLPTEADFF